MSEEKPIKKPKTIYLLIDDYDEVVEFHPEGFAFPTLKEAEAVIADLHNDDGYNPIVEDARPVRAVPYVLKSGY